MADNVTLPLTGSGDATAPVATDDVGGVHYQRVKLDLGADGLASPVSGSVPVNDNGGTISVDDGGASITVDGTVTANAGTNLNTSALALESGGNLAGAATSLAVIDDWDESDRAKVNPIVGQAGVQGGSGAVTAITQRVVLATDVAMPSGDNNIGNVDIVTVPAPLSTTGGGTEASALRVTVASDSTGVLSIDDNGSSITVDGTITANAGTGTRDVGGDTAHDSTDAGKPVSTGFQARTTNPTAVSDGDRVRAIADDIGRQVVVLNQVRDLVVHQHTQISSSSSETTIVTAGSSGVFHDLTHLVITNQTATAVNVTIKDATAGTTRMIVALAASGGAVIPFPVPVPQASAANNWTATLSSASVTVNIFAQAVKNV